MVTETAKFSCTLTCYLALYSESGIALLMGILSKSVIGSVTFAVATANVAPLTFPAYTDIIPCTDTAENCAKMYYGIQKNLQTSLDTALNSAGDAQDSASDLLDLVTSLKKQAEDMTDVIDPDNTRTNGGEVRVLATGKKLAGVTPFMATLSKRMTSSIGQRGSELRTAVNNLKTGMDQVVRMMQDSMKAANDQLSSSANKMQSAITSQSVQLRDFFNQIDQKLASSASSFDAASNAAPNATANALNTAIKQESMDYGNTKNRLSDIYNQVLSLPMDLDSYLKTLLSKLASYQIQQDTYANGLSVNQSKLFNDELNIMQNQLGKKLNGLLTESRNDPNYAYSVKTYMNEKRRDLDLSIRAANKTQQSSLNQLQSSFRQMTRIVSTAFGPILKDVAGNVTKISGIDAKYQTDVMDAYADANATAVKAKASFDSFTKNIDGLWNLTGGILSGQTTGITADLLAKIGNMTQQAGSEVDKLNTIMLDAAQSSLSADAVRQGILQNSRSQVQVMISNNEAAVNASFATINNFMKKSKSEIDLILNVVKMISGNQLQTLNQTASRAIADINTRISSVRNSTSHILNSVISSVDANIVAEQQKLKSTYNGYVQASQLQINQTRDLLDAMDKNNQGEFTKMWTAVNASQALVDSAIATANGLAAAVNGIPGEAEARRAIEMANLNAIIANATANLTYAQGGISSQFAAVKRMIETGGSSLGSAQTDLIASMASALNGASSSYDSQASTLVSGLQTLIAKIKANVTVTETMLSELNTKLRQTGGATDSAYRNALTQVTQDVRTGINQVRSGIDAYAGSAKTDVMSLMNTQIANVTGQVNSKVSSLDRTISDLESKVDGLTSSVDKLKNRPQMIVNKAQALQTQFKGNLDNLKSSILTLSTSNDALSSDFDKKVHNAFGPSGFSDAAGPHDGIDTLFGRLKTALNNRVQTARTAVDTGISAFNTSISVAQSAVQVKMAQSRASIIAHKKRVQADVDQLVNDGFNYMNQTFQGFKASVRSMNESIFSKIDSGKALEAQLASLQADVAAARNKTVDTAPADELAQMVQTYGASMASDIEKLMNQTQAKLSDAQKDEVRRQLMSANSALVGANRLALTGADLAAKVNAAIASATAEAGRIRANTMAVKERLNSIQKSANQTVQITSTDIAAIISKFRGDSEATRKVIKDQLAAAGMAEASVQDAMKIWGKLKAATTKMSQDEIGNLGQVESGVFASGDKVLQDLKTKSQKQIVQMNSDVAKIEKQVDLDHDANMGILTTMEQTLDGLAADAASTKSSYEGSLQNLRGEVNNLVHQLQNRYSAIVGMAGTFRTAIESSAARDIAKMTTV